MKKFKFRFQSILDLHTKDLEKAELEVAAAQKRVFDAKDKLNQLHNELDLKKDELTQLLSSGSVDILLINSFQYYIL